MALDREFEDVVQFDLYELDPRTYQLRRSGVIVDLPRQAVRVLSLLAAHPNKLVTRREIKDALWPGESHGDFDSRLNFAVKKLREKLGDNAEQPRYVQTMRNAGYMFIAPVRAAAESEYGVEQSRLGNGKAGPTTFELSEPAEAHASKLRFRYGLGALLIAAVGVAVAAVGFGAFALRPRAGSAVLSPQLASQVQISNLDGADGVPKIDWVSEISPEAEQRIEIRGRGFGLHVPYSHTDSPYLAIRDKTSDWAAGRMIPENWDEVTVDVESWTAGEIVISGFSGDYGKKGWKLSPGDQVEIAVWNPQTKTGPAIFRAWVNSGTDGGK